MKRQNYTIKRAQNILSNHIIHTLPGDTGHVRSILLGKIK